MKEIVIFNGSPRMDGNTATLLNLIARGARDQGAEVHFYTLFKMKFMACQSCFACRMADDASSTTRSPRPWRRSRPPTPWSSAAPST